MFNVFDQPWTLLTAATVALLIILMLRSSDPDRWNWWWLHVPVLLALLAFGLDRLVETDTEKIKKVIDTGIKAVEEENIKAINAIISANYHDSNHNTKQDLMDYCKSLLSQPLVEKNTKTSLVMAKPDTEATVFLTVLMQFDTQSYIYQSYKSSALIKMKISLQKQPNKSWLINRAEILEIDRQSVRWKEIG